jgi:glycosyltransferase involved in cell wall biosynthesis
MPVVATEVQGIKELIEDDVNGYLLANPPDPEIIADRLARLVDDAQLREEMGRRSTLSVRRYHWENIAREYMDIYREIVSRI